MNEFIPSINVRLSPSGKLRSVDMQPEQMRMLRLKLDIFSQRAYRHAYYAWHASEDDDLPGYIYLGLVEAAKKLDELECYSTGAVDAIDDALRAYEDLEDNLNFIFRDAASVLKKVRINSIREDAERM